MEIFELKYFLAVAEIENVNQAAEKIHVSAGSLSKAIQRLEDELQTPLFFKSGRGIKLTPEGVLLKKKASHIVELEQEARLELSGKEVGSLNVYISSEEILQSSFGSHMAKVIEKNYPNARIQFLIRSENKAIEQVLDGETHFALITQEPPANVSSKILSKVDFSTCISKKHPLYKKLSDRNSVSIDEVLNHNFVSPDTAILGKIAKSSSIDGWRDDKFPRKIKYKVCGLKLIENLILDGLAVGYLPNYFIESSGLTALKVLGCPYSCQQTIRVVAKEPESLSWLNKIWGQL